MLESTRDDFKRILADYESDEEGESNGETFSSEKISVEIDYTRGDCSEDSDDTGEWNVPKGKVKFIKIFFSDTVTLKDLNYDFSSLEKEQRYVDAEEDFIYHDKDKGIAFFVDVEEEEIERIQIVPARKQASLLCKNEDGEDAKVFYSTKSYFRNAPLEERFSPRESGPPKVTELILSEYEIAVSCSAVDQIKHKNCSISPRVISVSTTAFDSENDTLVYHYIVSGGRIIGEGKDVIWDLADVKPGTYTITAGVDDGCGVCGETKTRTVEVK